MAFKGDFTKARIDGDVLVLEGETLGLDEDELVPVIYTAVPRGERIITKPIFQTGETWATLLGVRDGGFEIGEHITVVGILMRAGADAPFLWHSDLEITKAPF